MAIYHLIWWWQCSLGVLPATKWRNQIFCFTNRRGFALIHLCNDNGKTRDTFTYKGEWRNHSNNNAVLGDLTGQIKVIQENESYQERESSLSKLSIGDSVKVSFAKKMGWYKGELGLIVDKYGSIQKISRSN